MIGAPIGQFPVGFDHPLAIDSSSGSFFFDSFDLSDCGEVSLDTSNHDDMNRISVDTYDAPRTDGGGVLGYFVRGKLINLKVIVIEDTESDLNDKIDAMKLKLFKKEGLLKIKINGVFRVCKANLTNINFNRDYEKKNILTNVVISFITMENLHAENATAVTENAITGATYPLDIDNSGARTDYKMILTFGVGIVGTSNISIQQDGYTLSIVQSIADGDILILDGIEKQVTLNGVAIDYDGPFVQLENGSNPVLLSIDGTYTADITYLYYKNYL